MPLETVKVTVQYVGKDDFVDTVPAQRDLQAVKVQAMKSFELDPSQASKYVLQFNVGRPAGSQEAGRLRDRCGGAHASAQGRGRQGLAHDTARGVLRAA